MKLRLWESNNIVLHFLKVKITKCDNEESLSTRLK